MQKKKTYILLLSVVLVWGLFFYKLLFPLQTKPEELPLESTMPPPVLEVQQTLKKTAIKANYRDPFLGVVKTPLKKKLKPKNSISKPAILFPKIEYLGVLNRADEFRFILEIENKQVYYKLQDTFYGVQLLSGNKEKVTVRYQSEKKTYPFQEKRRLY